MKETGSIHGSDDLIACLPDKNLRRYDISLLVDLEATFLINCDVFLLDVPPIIAEPYPLKRQRIFPDIPTPQDFVVGGTFRSLI